MRLSDFILENIETILEEWERFAASLAPGAEMSVLALRDHAEEILRVTARDMVASQTNHQQSQKSKGQGRGGAVSGTLDEASEQHAIERLGAGFNLMEVVSEYRALRASVLRLWQESARTADEHDLQDLARFNESMDQSLAEAVRTYTSRVDESRELFLATLGHDLRTPLQAIMLSSDLLAQSGQLDDENGRIASKVKQFGNVMSRMIHDLLDFTLTRLGAGMPVSVAPLDLADLCEEVLDEFRAAHPDQPVRLESTGNTSGAWDGPRLRQVVANLVANAIEHGDESSPVEVEVRGEDSDLVLTVTNQGAAIPASAIPTIFDPFVRAARTPRANDRRIHGGAGLGLYIAREIVVAHGGTIEVTSDETSGTRFRVCLPRGENRSE